MDSSRLISTGTASSHSQPPANALSFTGIRAPLTIDDDSDELEYSSSLSNAEYNSNSYTSSHNRSSISGEDDFGSGSDSEMDDSVPNEQTPFVNFRPTVEYSEGESIEEKSNLDDSLTSPDIINVEYRRGIPIALLSVDNDDDDSEGSIVMGDDGFSVERMKSAPKVRVLIDEGDENVIQPDIVLAEAGVDNENAQEKQVVVDNAQSSVSDYVEQQIAECTVPDSDCDVEEITVECGMTSKEPPLLLREIEPSGMQLEEEDIQSRDIEIVNLDIIIDSKPKELNSFATDDDNRVGETASLTQIGKNESKVKQEIHHIKGNEVQSSDSAENVQIWDQVDTTTTQGLAAPEGDELSRDSKISQSMAINSLPELQISNNCAFKSENSFSFNNDNEQVKESIDESEYRFDGERCLNIDGEVDRIEENKEKEKIDETDALLKAAGLGSTLVSQLLQDSNFFAHAERSKLEKIQQLRLNFLNIINTLNQPPEDSIGKPLPTEALQFEADDGRNLLCLNVLVIGKTGVGKSATINSIFHEHKTVTDAFKPATTTVKEIVGILQEGVMVRVLDTPGLRSSIPEQMYNRKILLSIKKAMIRCPPDVVLYVDRLDIQTSDLPLLKSITTYLGPSIWDKTIVTLTHAASSPPDGPTGKPLSYEMFVAQRLNDIQQLINHSVGDLHVTSPISLVENQHCLCMRNGNGENWRSQLLLLCCSMKIVSELTCVVKTRERSDFQRLDSESKLKLPYFSNSDTDKNEYGFERQLSLIWGRSCKVAIRAELNKKLSGRICIRTSSLDYTRIAAILCIITVAKDIMRRIYPHKL